MKTENPACCNYMDLASAILNVLAITSTTIPTPHNQEK